ncbi:hypothetical protein MOQ_008911 [Trypanosoma cruzi marinkellei]|uniref:Uncharacterized protein n=1 Tax=Trypanosoma cruzi marinkellei TaxID=85056 RepID=K2LXH4_TRYCR|nr:hypothetical protein MOQ_008911 [Trypanosoma cruzi marinkellei]
MSKRSRSVLHAYILPHTKRVRDERRKKRYDSLDVTAKLFVPPAVDAADNDGVPPDGDCGMSEAAFVAIETPDHIQSTSFEGWKEGNADKKFTLLDDEPFIPEADWLVGLPPSCRDVQREPNWLERALMLARCSNRCMNSFQLCDDNRDSVFPMPPDPTCMHLENTARKEKCRATAVANIAAAFYAAPHPADPSVSFGSSVVSRAH